MAKKQGWELGAKGIDGNKDVIKFAHPSYLTDDFVPWNGQRDISAKVDRAQAVNQGKAGRLPTRDPSNRAKAPAGRGKTKALPTSWGK